MRRDNKCEHVELLLMFIFSNSTVGSINAQWFPIWVNASLRMLIRIVKTSWVCSHVYNWVADFTATLLMKEILMRKIHSKVERLCSDADTHHAGDWMHQGWGYLRSVWHCESQTAYARWLPSLLQITRRERFYCAWILLMW